MSNGELTTDGVSAWTEPGLATRSALGLTSRVVRGSLWNLGGQGVTMIATLIATPFVIRLLGPERYGVLALVNIVIGYFSFADMGMGWASTRFASEAHAQGDDQREASTVWTALFLAAGPALIVSLGLALGARPIVEHFLRLPVYLQDTGVLAIRFAALGFLGRAIALIMNTPEIVRLRMDLLGMINVGTLVGQIFLIPIVLFLGGGLTDAAAIIAGSALLSALLHALMGMRLLPALRRPHISSAMLKPLARFGAGVMVSSLTTMVFAHADKFLITRYASIRDLAYYSVAFNLAILLIQAPFAMAQSLLPAFSQLQAKPERTALHQLYRRALQGTLFWVIPAAILLCIIARPFFSIWAGPEFGRESTFPLYLLAAGLIFEALAYVPYTLLNAVGRSDLIARCHLAVLFPYLIGSAVLIYWYGAPGAAAAWSIRAMITTLAFAVVVKRVVRFSFSPLPEEAASYLAALALMVVPVLLAWWLSGSTVVRLSVAVVALVSYGTLLLTRVLSSEERRWILRLVRLQKQS